MLKCRVFLLVGVLPLQKSNVESPAGGEVCHKKFWLLKMKMGLYI